MFSPESPLFPEDFDEFFWPHRWNDVFLFHRSTGTLYMLCTAQYGDNRTTWSMRVLCGAGNFALGTLGQILYHQDPEWSGVTKDEGHKVIRDLLQKPIKRLIIGHGGLVPLPDPKMALRQCFGHYFSDAPHPLAARAAHACTSYLAIDFPLMSMD